MKNDKPDTLKLFFLFLVIIAIAGCSGVRHKIRNQPPQIFIANIQVQNEDILFELQIKNINNIAIPEAQISFEFYFAGISAFEGSQLINLSLDGNGTENTSWRGKSNPAVLEFLFDLSNGQIESLDYRSKGELRNLTKNRTREFSTHGKVFAVPGKPGHFRVAGVSDKSRVDHEQINRDENYGRQR